ncbi:MAG: DUF1240 domain-containing protein [Desulfobacteraceae bacterium]|jgi:hypothetical protein
MNKMTSHTILFILDLFCIWGIWFGLNELKLTLSELNNQSEFIRFSNRAGFFVLGFGFPPIHLFTIVDNAKPSLFKKYIPIVNKSVIVLVAGLLVAGFICSSWIKSRVENAGYVYCHKASGVSALAKNLVYTKEMKICEDMVISRNGG